MLHLYLFYYALYGLQEMCNNATIFSKCFSVAHRRFPRIVSFANEDDVAIPYRNDLLNGAIYHVRWPTVAAQSHFGEIYFQCWYLRGVGSARQLQIAYHKNLLRFVNETFTIPSLRLCVCVIFFSPISGTIDFIFMAALGVSSRDYDDFICIKVSVIGALSSRQRSSLIRFPLQQVSSEFELSR